MIITVSDASPTPAVYDLLGKLDSTLTLDRIKPFLEAGSNTPNESLEAIVDAAGDLVGAGSKVTIDDRDALYTRLQAIDQVIYVDPAASSPVLKPAYQNLHITSVNALSADADQDTAKGFAYRYALTHLNPFAITGDAALYASQNRTAGGGDDYTVGLDNLVPSNIQNITHTLQVSLS